MPQVPLLHPTRSSQNLRTPLFVAIVVCGNLAGNVGEPFWLLEQFWTVSDESD